MTGVVVSITGLPASGKSSLAERVRARVGDTILLDSDEVRGAIGATAYDRAGRDAFYAALGGLAALLARQRHVVLVAATAHRRAYRDHARELAPRFVEVHVRTPVEVCEARDPKRLYAEQPRDLPGAGEIYEPPLAPDVVADGGHDDDAAANIAARIAHVVRD